MQRCTLCNEYYVGAEHEVTGKHVKNKALYEYSLYRKVLSGNKRGIAFKCNVSSSVMTVTDSEAKSIQISAKPNEEVKFYFHLSNENSNGCVFINFIQVPANNLNFTMNDHNLGYGCAPTCVTPESKLRQEIYVKFKSPHIGEYNMPIMVSCYIDTPNDEVFFMREMTVYVEVNNIVHETINSPYSNKAVMAETLIRTTKSHNNENQDEFRIPKNYKTIYAHGLKVKPDSAENIKSLAEDIRNIFRTGITQDNYIRFFHHLLWYEETIVRINLKKYNMTGVTLERVGGDALKLLVPGLAEKRPSLLLGDLVFVKPQQTDAFMFEAVISEILENYIHIRGLDDQFWQYYGPSYKYDVRFFMSRMPLERMHCAVHSVVKHGHEARVFPQPATRKVPKPKSIQNYYNLLVEQNPEQRLAVEHIVAGTAGLAPYLLHGPPGTGKTVTIVEAILQLVNKDNRNRILVCTDSNMAADHVATMLIRYTHMFPHNLLLRANSKYRVWETLPDCLIKFSNGSDFFNFRNVSVDEFLSYRIIIATLSHAAKYVRQFRVMRNKHPITHLFIDEAAQASEPACLIPMCGLLEKNGSLVLAGDPLQLGPVVISNNARLQGYYNLLVEQNPEQRLAVEHIVAGTAGLAPYLLHGPPGTGKTVTIVEAILQLVNKDNRNRILVCTDSNMAADHVATMLIRYTHMFPHNLLLRANSKYRVWETLPDCLIKFSNGSDFFNFRNVSVDEFLSYRIIIATLSHAAKYVRQFRVMRNKHPITHLFIDEAAQASEPACLIPMCGLLEKNGSLVLAGDPLQLGPVVISNNARLQGLGLSLMERLMTTCPLYGTEEADMDPKYTVMLRNNFRSNPDILEIPNRLFYKGQLRALAIEDKISNVDILGEKKESRAIVFHGVLSQESKMGKSPSYFNNMEFEIVQMYVTALLKRHGIPPEDIGIVTPYIRQVYKIKSWLLSQGLKTLEVGTVEAFQGKEKRVIVVSTVRASCGLLDHDAKYKLGFLVDDKVGALEFVPYCS
ncbi:putative helicase mov-10-B.2 [Ostrinia furnacalis]|uniref:putative helicase mov-10-B.2 n=1 Tax=Ostrinia furnacalis TaxID=93504 RepID=UPI00103B00A1|nr:putative helicase mov-10-B.2 [Ostrinia furnacalis]